MIETVQQLLDSLYSKGKRRDIVRIDANASAQEAAALMRGKHINLLAVIDKATYVGVVTSSDTSGEFGTSARPSERTVFDIMTRDVITVSTDDELMKIPQRFQNIRHLVVVDEGGKWIAILDSNEVLDAVMENVAEEEQTRDQSRT